MQTKQPKFKFYATLLDAFTSYLKSDAIWERYWGFSENPPHTPEEFRQQQFQSLIDTINQTVAITELRGSISALTSQVSGMYNIADETRTILANSYLELQQIRENTGEIVKPIKQIQADIAEVKQNTSRL